MKKLLLATAMLLPALPSYADVMSITFSETGFAPLTFTTPPGVDAISVPLGTPYGSFILNGVDAIASPLAPAPDEISTNTINVSATGAPAPLKIDIKASSVADLAALAAPFDSFFSVTGITTGWTVTGQTLIDGLPLANTPTITANFAVHLPGTADTTGLDTYEVIYTIDTNGVAGSINGGIDIAAVPGPIVGAGMPGLLGVLGMGLLAWRRKRNLRGYATAT
jgi:hypothetical protein